MEEEIEANSIPPDCRAIYNCGLTSLICTHIAVIDFPHKMFFRTKFFSFIKRFLNKKITFSECREKEVGNQ